MSSAPTPDATLVALSNLSSGLWRIQELLDTLTYALEVQQVLVESGRSRWVARSTRDVENVLQEMREAELMRAVDIGPVCVALDLPEDTPLSEIATVAPAPWDHVLTEHRSALTKLTKELAALSRSNSSMLEMSFKAVQETLDRFNHAPESATYTAKGSRASEQSRHLFDQST